LYSGDRIYPTGTVINIYQLGGSLLRGGECHQGDNADRKYSRWFHSGTPLGFCDGEMSILDVSGQRFLLLNGFDI
jgi:hypothetical protein